MIFMTEDFRASIGVAVIIGMLAGAACLGTNYISSQYKNHNERMQNDSAYRMQVQKEREDNYNKITEAWAKRMGVGSLDSILKK